jgi:hypothetical protein
MPRRPLAVAALALALTSCFTDPQQQIDQMQQMTDLADALTELNQRSAELQFTLDSMRSVLARQDTVLRRVAAATGVDYR